MQCVPLVPAVLQSGPVKAPGGHQHPGDCRDSDIQEA